jgi:REP element-mobilizing transposase RayT
MAHMTHRHLRRLQHVFIMDRAPIYFVTACAHERLPCLTHESIAPCLVKELRRAADTTEWLIGLYVVMPDHVHLLCGPQHMDAASLSRFMALWKGRTSLAAGRLGHPRIWQKGFFDHLLRQHESYAERFEYVRNNPVRAGLCAQAHAWPWMGEPDILR